jgi:hypothetical protein
LQPNWLLSCDLSKCFSLRIFFHSPCNKMASLLCELISWYLR